MTPARGAKSPFIAVLVQLMSAWDDVPSNHRVRSRRTTQNSTACYTNRLPVPFFRVAVALLGALPFMLPVATGGPVVLAPLPLTPAWIADSS
jgi:hypothetical protein